MSTIAEGAVTERLVRVETKIDLLLADIAPRHVDHENRIRKLEAKVYVAAGFAAASGGGLGALIAHLTGA